MRLIVLGSGTSFGVPQVGCACATCTSSDPRDRRTRVSAVFEAGARRILIDTGPELRLQLTGAGITRIDAVLYTHEHADHVHGIDDLRGLSDRDGPLALYGPDATLANIRRRFDYIFDDGVRPPAGSSKPQLETVPLVPGTPVEIAGMSVLPLDLDHGVIRVFGYRIGDAAYLTDVKSVSSEAIGLLAGVRVLVLNALFEQRHPTHLSIPEAIDVVRAVGPERAYLTHLSHRYSHEQLRSRLPVGIEPAWDGLVIDL